MDNAAAKQTVSPQRKGVKGLRAAARKLGVSAPHLSLILNGHRPDSSNLVARFRALSTPNSV
jgi:hypothetical protein